MPCNEHLLLTLSYKTFAECCGAFACVTFQISRTQLNHIKRLKHSGDGIQTKHVSRVVGGLDKFAVKPFGALMEGEQIRLREHWSVMF
jgi:hypothetical protein